MKTTLERGSTQPLKDRFVSYLTIYAETSAKMPPPEPAAGTTGALKGALNRSARYNDPKTRATAPKAANAPAAKS